MKGQDEELELLSLCLDYLRLPAFDQDLDQESAKKFVLDGYYAFMDYALASWTVHLDNILQNSPQGQNKTSKRLTSTLQAFFQTHPIPSDKIRVDKSVSERLRRFKKENFFIQLVQIMQTASEVNYEDTPERVVQTSRGHLPSQVSLVRKLIESLTEIPSTRIKLREIYGCRLFRCPRLQCHYFYEGFSHA